MQRGDHLFVYCVGYSHHGIYCGEDRVIHFDSDPARKVAGLLSRPRAPVIAATSLGQFARNRPVHIRVYGQESAAVQTVIDRAESRLGEQGYHLFGNNCEHFAIWCKTGRYESTQVEAATDAAKATGAGLAASAVVFRTARFLSPPYRLAAYSTALTLTLGSGLHRYFARRRQSFAHQES